MLIVDRMATDPEANGPEATGRRFEPTVRRRRAELREGPRVVAARPNPTGQTYRLCRRDNRHAALSLPETCASAAH